MRRDRARLALPHHRERVIVGELKEELAALDAMSRQDLRGRWAMLTGRAVPEVSAKMLRLAIGYELQAKAHGALSRAAVRNLDQAAAGKSVTSDLRPGMRLAREHGGTVHVVTIGEAGEIIWNAREWRSLSEVARAITGTRWSGPAFFGLRKADRKAAA